MFGDCSDSTEDMTIDSRDSKEYNTNNIMDIDDHHNRQPEQQQRTNMSDECRTTPPNRLTKETDDNDLNDEETSRRRIDHDSDNGDMDSEPPMHKRQKMDSEEVEQRSSPASSPNHMQKISNIESKSTHDVNDHDDDTNSKDRKSCTPDSSSHNTSTSSPAKSEDNCTESHVTASSPQSQAMPKLRLNALLASDPALMPDAKDLKVVHESQAQQRKQQRMQQQQQHEREIDSPASHLVAPGTIPTVVEPLIKAQPTPPVEVAPPRMKVFMCVPCGIGFSSPSTLEAHQSYYCSHRHKDNDEDSVPSASALADKTSTSPATQANVANATPAVAGGPEPAAKAPKTGKQYACTQCSYSADKKVSLNRHMRMHQTSPAPSSNSNNGGAVGGSAAALLEDNTSQQIDRYCSDCDIRFNNVKTYRAHKQHYCSSRRTEGQLTPKLEVSTTTSTTPKANSVHSGAISPQTRTKTPTPAMVAAAAAAAAAAALQQPPSTPFLALPTNPILIIPYSLIRSASLIAGPLQSPSPSVVNPDTTCFTLDGGQLKPLATALNINALSAANNLVGAAAAASSVQQQQQYMVDSTRQTSSSSNESLLTEKNVRRNIEEPAENTPKRKGEGLRDSAPLDLSLRRSPIAALLQRQQRLTAAAAASFLESANSEHHPNRLDMETLLEAGKENLVLDDTGSITPEQIVCAPSLPNSPSMSPSPRRRAISPRSSGAGSTSSMSPPATIPPTAASASNPTNIFDNLHLRSMLPAELLNPLLANKNLELALKLSAAAAAAAVSSSNSAAAQPGTTPAELAAAAVAAAASGRGALLGLPVLPPTAAASGPAQPATPAAANQPQIYVKQGVSKCKECNIVFCKYENYLAHKQHYCSARNQEASEGETKISSTPPMATAASPAETTPVAYQQLICAACGIKYTSLDNLRAHQNYYCPKGGGAVAAAAAAAAAAVAVANPDAAPLVLPAKEKCTKCKTVHEFGLPCPPPPALVQQPAAQTPVAPPSANVATAAGSNNSSSSVVTGHNQNVYKCPLCDAVSLTASESRKHMETHGTVKAFRCTICRYKGNTLRGMRTHIRMHFDKKSTDLNEEHFMACILEDESIEIPSAASLNQEHLVQQHQQQQKHLQQQVAAAAAVAAGLQQQQQQQQHQQQQSQSPAQQVFNCDICNYSSTYKGNVLRHMKLVHPHIITNSPSISPEAGDLEASETNSLSGSHNGDNGLNSFTIKSEPLDHPPPPTVGNTTPVILLNPHDNNHSPLPNIGQHPVHGNDFASHHIKTEPMEIAVGGEGPPPPPSISMSITPALRSPAIGPPPPLNSTPEENINNQKYCQTCDISFNYMKTYLAHKQFYCKNKMRRPDSNDSPSPNPTAGIGSPNALMMQKNKENLQQEAAI